MPSTPSSHLWFQTSLIYSSQISARLGCQVYLKLETLQPSQSFKYRGISLFAQNAIALHGRETHLVAASGGNAGLAVAYAARHLNVKCTIFIPEAAKSVKPVLEREKAVVVVGGEAYVDALREAEKLVASSPDAVMVPAYDDPLLWRGHSTMITELTSQLPANTPPPSAILCSVGGGGLLGGLLTGVNSLGWRDTTVVALETEGSNCFHQSMLQNDRFCAVAQRPALPDGVTVRSEEEGVRLVTLPRIMSRAASLGASSPSAGVVKMALEWRNVRCVTVRDEMSMGAGLLFLEEHKMLIELACSTTLVPAYSKPLFDAILPPASGQDPSKRTVVFIVCGGVKISLHEIEEYEKLVHADTKGSEALIDGQRWVHPVGL
ncbi:tryptophan synthase beta subunit-like PLP-dependent enzyme [Dacryopinax primogenitus]|uniref:L-serine ammonia-lyase n=1 Tax=Dacryopinax primogenitus (strain DJM 731) TaxID=1858805 RepID=M5G8Z9_DACPD|nr:tryptophan synthase beta subunit-like PLP-dependent enzyme [Dacryopinax primogenitus]EJU00253.1 tryptophan synthase beta subunit-like PLP-dependent enzyme [Dacryopinax primogenitus]